jgi:hypothetical protein
MDARRRSVRVVGVYSGGLIALTLPPTPPLAVPVNTHDLVQFRLGGVRLPKLP